MAREERKSGKRVVVSFIVVVERGLSGFGRRKERRRFGLLIS